MRKLLLYLVGSIALLVLAGVGVVAFIASRVEDQQIRDILAQRLASGLGRQVEIAGRFDLYMGWTPTITVRRVKIANAAWGTQPTMLELGRMEARLQLFPLLTRKGFSAPACGLIFRDCQKSANSKSSGTTRGSPPGTTPLTWACIHWALAL